MKMKSAMSSTFLEKSPKNLPSLKNVTQILNLLQKDISFRRFAILLVCKTSISLPTNKSLASYFGVTEGGMSQSIGRLEQAGLVTRITQPDKKGVQVKITKKGDKLVRALGAWANT